MLRTYIVFLAFLLAALVSAAQNAQNDSLIYKPYLEEYEKYKHTDPRRAIRALNHMQQVSAGKHNQYFFAEALVKKGVMYYFDSKYDSAEFFARQAVNAARASGHFKALMNASNLIGAICYNKGDMECAVNFYKEKSKVALKLKDTASEMETYYNISLVLFQQGQYFRAAEYDFKALDYFERKRDTTNMVLSLHGIGYIYMFLEDFVGSLHYLHRAIQLIKPRKENFEVTGLYIDISGAYENMKKRDSAFYFIDQAMKISSRENDEYHYVIAANHKAEMYLKNKNYSQALILTKEAEKLDLKANRIISLSEIYDVMARIYSAQKIPDSALKYSYKAYAIAQKLNKPTNLQVCSKILSESYELKKNSDSAYKYYKMYSLFNDTLQKSSQLRGIGQKEFLYEKQNQENLRYREQVHAQAELKRQKQVSGIVMIASVMMLILMIVGIFNYRQKQKASAEVIRQKRLLEEKNKEVADSINYASRIQKSIMPDEKALSEVLPDGFVLYQPKDVVSGDFYWIHRLQNSEDKTMYIIAAADCTGHGVPGAFMSLIGATILNQTLNNSEINNPAQALDYLNLELPRNIKSTGHTGTIKDGMEVAMFLYMPEQKLLQFAGANNNLYLVRKGELQLIRGDKRPIGQGYESMAGKFTHLEMHAQSGDMLYLSTDGFPDQFGGPKGKKFKYRQMEDLFLSIYHLPVHEQKIILKKKFLEWKGDLEQVDDVCIIGFRIGEVGSSQPGENS